MRILISMERIVKAYVRTVEEDIKGEIIRVY